MGVKFLLFLLIFVFQMVIFFCFFIQKPMGWPELKWPVFGRAKYMPTSRLAWPKAHPVQFGPASARPGTAWRILIPNCPTKTDSLLATLQTGTVCSPSTLYALFRSILIILVGQRLQSPISYFDDNKTYVVSYLVLIKFQVFKYFSGFKRIQSISSSKENF